MRNFQGLIFYEHEHISRLSNLHYCAFKLLGFFEVERGDRALFLMENKSLGMKNFILKVFILSLFVLLRCLISEQVLIVVIVGSKYCFP